VPIHPTLDLLRQLGLVDMVSAYEDLAARAAPNLITLNGLACCSAASWPIDRTVGSRLDCAMPGCVIMPRSENVDYCTSVVSTVRCFRNWRSAAGSMQSRT
jgi:hypothetical protein